MVDIDWFKRINDTYGHPAGDHVLTEFAWRLRDHIRKTDFLARIGGEEFAIIMPETNSQEARKRSEQLQRIINETSFQLFGTTNMPLAITASFGISCVAEKDLAADAVLLRADAALYKAKNNGRNQVELYHGENKLTLVTE